MELIMENVRCFAGKHRVPIKPLTILVGENSSGKTTFLAALSTVCDLRFLLQPGFNEPPYSLGNFSTIATYNGKNKAGTKQFSLGYVRPTERGDCLEVIATYRDNKGQVELLEATSKGKGIEEFQLVLNGYDKKYKLVMRPSNEKIRKILYINLEDVLEQRSLKSFADILATPKNIEEVGTDSIEGIISLMIIIGATATLQTLSIAPIRTKPKRTYDEFTDRFNPEGDHIPFSLARILSSKPASKQERSLVYMLKRFGAESGLFKNVQIKQLGNNPGDPFQIMVTVGGRPANVVDVGYGVSQALPVVVQSILAAEAGLILIQQPEVHLHPKAQAALGSFFVDMVTDGGKQFVVETHSDYIVDRIRQEVAAGKIESDSVSILFFEKTGIETTIHQIGIDDLGNVVGAPPSYREFFLSERLNLLSRGKR